MRTKRAVPARHRPLGAAVTAGLILLTAAALAGCSSDASSSSAVSAAAASAPSAAAYGAAAAAVPAASASASAANGAAVVAGGSGQAAAAADIAPGGRQLIYTAQLTVRAASVAAAVSRATSVVAAADGYVSAENATAGNGQPSQATATVTFKIPVAAYPATLAALSGGGLGTRLSLSQQAQDVTQQVADVASRVASDQAAIAQLRALLARAGSVSALLTVQDQINTEETDLESMLAQQNALDHETAYATLTLTVVGPKAVVKAVVKKPPAPSGLSGGLARGWHGLRMTVGWLLTVGGIVAPFAAALAIVGTLAWWIRRRLGRLGRERLRRERRPAQ